MKVRIKFSKEGPMIFVGHLDTMRYFQKAIRRAELPAAFSGGFSPHMIMSFAAPLGVGTAGLGEYFDVEFTEDLPTGEIERRLSAVMAEGFRVVSARRVEEGKAGKAMSLVAAADYLVKFREGREPAIPWRERMEEFVRLPQLPVTKQTKKGEKALDIRPFIYEMKPEGEGIFLRLASASGNYTKPELVMDTFLKWLGTEAEPYSLAVQRLEVYADLGTEEEHRFVSLEELGEETD